MRAGSLPIGTCRSCAQSRHRLRATLLQLAPQWQRAAVPAWMARAEVLDQRQQRLQVGDATEPLLPRFVLPRHAVAHTGSQPRGSAEFTHVAQLLEPHAMPVQCGRGGGKDGAGHSCAGPCQAALHSRRQPLRQLRLPMTQDVAHLPWPHGPDTARHLIPPPPEAAMQVLRQSCRCRLAPRQLPQLHDRQLRVAQRAGGMESLVQQVTQRAARGGWRQQLLQREQPARGYPPCVHG